MIRSFLNIFLPEDEYKRTRVLYFMAETTFLSVIILLLLGFLKYILNYSLDTEFILLLGPFFILAYPYCRFIFSGIEHTEVSNKQDYRKRRYNAGLRSLLFGFMYFCMSLVVKGIPVNNEELIDSIAVPIIVVIIYFLFEWISLKQSFKKNSELDN